MNLKKANRILRGYTSAVAIVCGVVLLVGVTQGMAEDTSIRPSRFKASEAQIRDLRMRIKATRWPKKELVTDATQGVQLETMKALTKYWASDYDWRKAEAKLNALPQFVTNIDGVDIHFIHVPSKNPNALPLIITHGWPGSILEQIKVIAPLTDPVSYGGKVEDSFDVVIPSLPGYGFSGKPTARGWDPQYIARAWIVLMKRLGYNRYVAQGGDWGNAVTEQMALLAPPELLAIHTNMPATIPDDVANALSVGPPCLACRQTSNVRMTNSIFSTSTDSVMPRRWRPALRHCTDLPIHQQPWQLG